MSLNALAPARAFGLAAVLAIVATGAADAQEPRRWTADPGEQIIIADCEDCGDDLGMLASCTGDGDARVEVPWLAGEQAMSHVPLYLSVGAQRYVFDASTTFHGQVGNVPTFSLPLDHPLIPAMQGGNSVQVGFDGDVPVSIGLAGARLAFDNFRAACRFASPMQTPGGGQQGNQPPVFGGGQQGGGSLAGLDLSVQSPADQYGARWFLAAYDPTGMGGPKTLSLTYGVPETDGIAVDAACAPGNPGPYIPTLLSVDFGGLPNGVPTSVMVSIGNRSQTYDGTVFILSEESEGVSVAFRADDPFWQALQTGPVTFEVKGGRPLTLQTMGSKQVIDTFLLGCGRIFGG